MPPKDMWQSKDVVVVSPNFAVELGGQDGWMLLKLLGNTLLAISLDIFPYGYNIVDGFMGESDAKNLEQVPSISAFYRFALFYICLTDSDDVPSNLEDELILI
ncbi:hypothetical protein ACJX0J_020698, partial [Zea mays]